jgi:hypothetical protein
LPQPDNRDLAKLAVATLHPAEHPGRRRREAAYDIWINDLNKEVMFWVDNHGQSPAG